MEQAGHSKSPSPLPANLVSNPERPAPRAVARSHRSLIDWLWPGHYSLGVWWLICLMVPASVGWASTQLPMTDGARLSLLALTTVACSVGGNAFNSGLLASVTAASASVGILIFANTSNPYSTTTVVGCAALAIWFSVWSTLRGWIAPHLISTTVGAAMLTTLVFPPDVLMRSINWWRLGSALAIVCMVWIGPFTSQAVSVSTNRRHLRRFLVATSDRIALGVPLWFWVVSALSIPQTAFDPDLAAQLGIWLGLGFLGLALIGARVHRSRPVVSLALGASLLIAVALPATYSPTIVISVTALQSAAVAVLAWFTKDTWAAALSGGYALTAASGPVIGILLYG